MRLCGWKEQLEKSGVITFDGSKLNPQTVLSWRPMVLASSEACRSNTRQLPVFKETMSKIQYEL